MSEMRRVDPAAVRQSRRLRRVGLWTEQDWQMQGDPPMLVKHFSWAATAMTTHKPTELALTYWAQARLKPAMMEQLHARVEQERFALDKLEGMVFAATRGYAYITPPVLDQMVAAAMIGLLKNWTDGGQYPLNYAAIIRGVIRNTFTVYNAEIAGCEAFKAHVDPDHPEWGLRVAITPLVPSSPLIETM